MQSHQKVLIKGLSLGFCRMIALLALSYCSWVVADVYPHKSVRVVVPFGPGGGSDITARMFSQKLSEAFNQQFVVDNRGGAGGLIGMEITAKSQPDGYTLMMMSASFAATSALHQPSWDPIKNIIPVVQFGTTPFVLVAHPSVKANTVKEFIALAGSKSNSLTYASTGLGGITHLATELLMDMTKTKMVHVPYKSTGAAIIDVLAGQAPIMVASMLPVVPHIQAGKLRGLAVTTLKRWYSLPEIPPLAETVPGYNVELWFGVMAPRGTPASVIKAVNAAINKSIDSTEVKKTLDKDGMIAAGGSPDQFGKRIITDYTNWVKVIKAANISVN
ncbi:MAG: tripartite tricarboxylate transporter substrate binding protein [Betaproteobacteria bacterium]